MQPIFPLQAFLQPLSQNPWTYFVFGLIGFFFGYVLEISGFGNSKKLAAQFYFKDLTVLKVMFTAIVTAMVLIFLSSAIGILDFNLVYVPETHLWPGIIGGLIMGVGFIVGGFCPGTSVVSASTLKIDGIVFVIGAFAGVWAFGETVQSYWDWWNSSGSLGRLTLMDVFHLPTGVMVLLVVLMALFMFWGGEQLERIFGKRDLTKEPRLRLVGGSALVLGALAIILIGQPSTAEKWTQISPQKDPALANREVQIAPGEMLASMADDTLNIVLLDVRPEADYNLFHIHGARNVQLTQLSSIVPELLREPAGNTIYVVMSNDEGRAVDAWKDLSAESVANVYILEGGVNNWISTFAAAEPEITPTPSGNDRLAYTFSAALGDHYDAANPNPLEYKLKYTPKIKLQRKRSPSGGGCG